MQGSFSRIIYSQTHTHTHPHTHTRKHIHQHTHTRKHTHTQTHTKHTIAHTHAHQQTHAPPPPTHTLPLHTPIQHPFAYPQCNNTQTQLFYTFFPISTNRLQSKQGLGSRALYGVATISRLLNMIGLFCRVSSF